MKKIRLTESQLVEYIKKSVIRVINEQGEGQSKLREIGAVLNRYETALHELENNQDYVKRYGAYKRGILMNRNQLVMVYNAIVFEGSGIPEAQKFPVAEKVNFSPVWLDEIEGKNFAHWLSKLHQGIGDKNAIGHAHKIMRSKNGKTMSQRLLLKPGQTIAGRYFNHINQTFAKLNQGA